MTTNKATRSKDVTLVGAGLAGCLLATLLGRRGYDVTVLERRADPRRAGAERGRSINLALSARGLDALERVGLREEALAAALPMRGRMVHPVTGSPNFQSYSADGTRAINSISRSGLNEALLDTAEKTPGVTVLFESRVEAVDLERGVVTVARPDGVQELAASIVLACDGAYSATRRAVQFREGTNYAQDFLEHGYKELTIPARDGDFAIDPTALHIWARGGSMMIALPNLDKSFTCTLFWPKDGPGGLSSLSTAAQVRAHFAREYPDVVDLMPTLAEDYLANPVGSLVTVRAWPWTAHGAAASVALVGDAAHAIVPFYGQGANCAFEDAIEIDTLLDRHDGDWSRVLPAYEKARKPNTDAIAAMALQNFVEMRDLVNSRVHRTKNTAMHALERWFPSLVVSRYELVSFSTVPYAEVLRRTRRQGRVLTTIGALGATALGAIAARGLRRR
ncbi:FAD-dependent oxidoreductase [Nocardioides kongjuensis]|uniref:Kynurenine 3-monooxygenase n=1 Tax=Nocardioides kongjuensis TaxID=349522 RepID=A0A852RQW0_9ACTN|nr:kynurenine 3-monooxygenase [Nocardioides kongjuensis]